MLSGTEPASMEALLVARSQADARGFQKSADRIMRQRNIRDDHRRRDRMPNLLPPNRCYSQPARLK